MFLLRLFALVFAVCLSGGVQAHGGGLNADGCHTNRKTGEYHCHGSGAAAAKAKQSAEPPIKESALQATETTARKLPYGCYIGPRGGTYTITKSGKKNYGGC
jgi:hypothetical protein